MLKPNDKCFECTLFNHCMTECFCGMDKGCLGFTKVKDQDKVRANWLFWKVASRGQVQKEMPDL